MTTHQVHIALGSNLSDPELGDSGTILTLAADAVCPVGEGSRAVSSLWISEPVGAPGTGFCEQTLRPGLYEHAPAPDFINAVLRFDTRLTPDELLDRLLEIETSLGRIRGAASGFGYRSRTIDLDILAYDDRQIDKPHLTIPHPRARERLFVLLPLQEVSPNFRFPGSKESIAQLIARAPKIRLRKASPFGHPLA